MNKKISTLVALISVLNLAAPSARADGKSEFLVFLSADNLVRQSVQDPIVQIGDFTPTVDFLFAYNDGPWRFLSEIYLTDDEAEVERLQIGYEFSTDSTFWVGRFHQPISVWNHRYHHGAYLQPSISRPSIENWEDEAGILPGHVTGVMVDAWRPLGKTNGLRYALSVGLAPIFSDGELLPYDVLDPDTVSDRLTGSISVAYYPDFVGESNVGLVGGYTEIEVQSGPRIGNTSDIQVQQTIFGIQGNWESDNWRLIAAAYHVDSRSPRSSVPIDGTFVSGYLQAIYDLGKSTNMYGRLEWTHNPEALYLQLLPAFVYKKELIGVRWDFLEQQAIHFELSNNRTTGDKFSEIRVQWSAAFP